MSLRTITSVDVEIEKHIDFQAAALYLPAIQVISGTVFSAVVSIAACVVVPDASVSAIRTLALSAAAGGLSVKRPLQLGTARGVATIFAALRPCSFIFIFALMLEQTLHTCAADEAVYDNGVYRRWLYNACTIIMLLAGLARARAPRAESDLPLAACLAAAVAIASFPPPGLALSGPLCLPPTLFQAAERITRAFLFSLVYSALVYAAAPLSSQLHDASICVLRSTTAAAWILSASVYTLPLVALQLLMILYFSFTSSNLEYAGVGTCSERGLGSRSPSMEASTVDNDIMAKAAALTDSMPLVQSLNSGGFNFQLNPSPHACGHGESDEQRRMMEVAASIP